MTCTERRPGDGHRDGGRDRGRSAAEASARLDDPELLAAVHRLVTPVLDAVRRRHGPIPGVGTARWWAAGDDGRLAGLLVLAEAYLLADPERMARERLKALAVDLAAATSWTAASRRPSHAQLEHRRRA